jgi:hypothetical protein
MMRDSVVRWTRLGVLPLVLLSVLVFTASAAKMPVIPKWSRYEQSFKSSFVYSNALHDVSLKVVFTSPLGETREVDGFWDGARTWRVRFAPDQPGRWRLQTTCSDPANTGLHKQSGAFVCSAAVGINRFHKHGPVRVSLDHRYLEHADGTPFFWLADTAWRGARAATPQDWDFYALTRAYQRFTVAQWAVAPGQDVRHEYAWTGLPERIAINPDFFKRLDAKLDTLSRVGVLSAIVPLQEVPAREGAAALPDDQAELLVRYIVARWGAEPVAWLLAVEGDSAGKNAARWKRIGQAVFGSRAHAPVVLFPGETHYLFDEFRDQKWVDVFGYPSVTDLTDDALKWTFTGPFAAEWKKDPTRPLIPFLPRENGVTPRAGKRFSADDVRHAAYWSLFLTPPAGVSYRAEGVVNWDMTVDPKGQKTKGADLPLWHKALFMPGAKQMARLAKFMNSTDFWKLRPQPTLVASQPGEQSPQRFIAAVGSEPNTLAAVYVPEDRTLDLALAGLPPSPSVGWLNPRTGEGNVAVAVVGGNNCQFPTPEPGDWVLQMKAGK